MAAVLNVQSDTYAGGVSVFTYTNYVVPSGDDKILFVAFGGEHNSAFPTVNTVTHDGVSLTQRSTANMQSGFGEKQDIWDLPLGSSTPSGDVVVTCASSVGLNIHMIVATISGVAQQAPEAESNGTGTTQPINTDIVTITGDAFIVDAISGGQPNTLSVTQGPEQVEDVSIALASISAAVSHEEASTAGTYTLGWSQAASTNRLCHCVIAYELATASGGVVSSMANHGGLAGSGGIAGKGGGIAG